MSSKSEPRWAADRRDGHKAMRGRTKHGIGNVNRGSFDGTLALERCGGLTDTERVSLETFIALTTDEPDDDDA